MSADARWGRTFHCGPFSGERYRGALRWVEAGGVECLRMVGVVVRDSAWRTLSPSKLVERAKGERWTVDGRTAAGSGTLLWRLSLLPRPRGMEVRAAMRACGNVLTNRSGLVVLLPAARFAGARYVVRHADTRTNPTRRRWAAIQPRCTKIASARCWSGEEQMSAACRAIASRPISWGVAAM